MQRALKTARYVYYVCDKLKLCNTINEILFSIKEHLLHIRNVQLHVTHFGIQGRSRPVSFYTVSLLVIMKSKMFWSQTHSVFQQ